jgi:hypothetical protein
MGMMSDRIRRNLSITLREKIYFDNNNVLEIVNYVYTSMRLFISSTPDFQVLSINEQHSLYERNLLGISAVYRRIFSFVIPISWKIRYATIVLYNSMDGKQSNK